MTPPAGLLLLGGERGDQPAPLLGVLLRCRRGRAEGVVELDVRVHLEPFGACEGEQGLRAEQVGPPVDPAGVDKVEEVGERQVTQP
jgi:hypothetical protein